MLIRFLTSLSLAGLCLSAASQGAPQTPRMPRMPYRVSAYPGVYLLTWEIVQDDIGLRREISDELKKARNIQHERLQQQMQAPLVRQPKVEDPTTAAAANAFSQLTSGQKKRLAELYLQYHDVNALADPEVARLVGLSADQRDFLQQRLTAAHHRYLEAMDGLRVTQMKDREEAQKRASDLQKASPGLVYRNAGAISREVHYRQLDQTRRAGLLNLSEMVTARADIRAKLTPSQLAKFNRMKGRPIPHWFFEGGNWGVAQRHPELILHTSVQAELGFSLKKHLEIQARRDDPKFVTGLLAELNPDQQSKLHGFGLQFDREYSILRQDVSGDLGLSRSVVDQMLLKQQQIDVKAFKDREDLWVSQKNPDEDVSARQSAIMRSADDAKRKAILDLLTEEQKAKWNRMLGTILPGIQPTRHFS